MSTFEKVATTDDVELGQIHPTMSEVSHSKEASTTTLKAPSAKTATSLRFNEGGLKEATIVWKNLNKFVELNESKSKKQILFDVNGVAKPGDMIALMGPSGSGKTTLLNVLGGRALANLTGEVLINNVKYRKSMRRTIAYVLQEDIFYMNLTVRQQLYFTSNLRLPDSLSQEKKKEVVDHVIKTLRIDRCADTKILLISGTISFYTVCTSVPAAPTSLTYFIRTYFDLYTGGEKKRCNIGTELLTNPSILLLDEPTSGLDSTAANALVNTLRDLAEEKMTIITSIHQPSSKVSFACKPCSRVAS
jgi:ABC-type multidrug transport system ATPase subunit